MKRFLAVLLSAFIFLGSPVLANEKTVELKVGDNVALGDLLIPEDGSLQNGVVLLTHGTMAHKDMELIQTLQTALADHGVASLAHTLTLGMDRRKGMFDCNTVHGHIHSNAKTEIGLWVGWLKEQGAGSVFVLGHSRGGAQVAAVAKENAERVAGVVLLASTTSGYREKQRLNYQKSHGANIEEFVTQAVGLIKEGKPTEAMTLPGFLHCPETKVQARTVVSYYGPSSDDGAVAHIKALTQPVLVVAGSKDTVVPDLPDAVRPMVDGKNVMLEIIEDADHFFLDFYAEDAAEKIASFVNSG